MRPTYCDSIARPDERRRPRLLYWRKRSRLKRKPILPPPETSLVEGVLEEARLMLDPEKVKRESKCVVCGSESAPNSAENLCWVCRRLKISAWRDSDQQMNVQE